MWQVRMHERARILQTVRQFFNERDFLEVDTPVAIRAPAPEVAIEAVETLFAPSAKRFLQTSPELCMKRLLALGLPRIFQIAVVFRDGDYSDVHTPEFRLLEWYRANASWTSLLEDCEALLRACAGDSFIYNDQTIDLKKPFLRLTVEEAFVRYAGFSLLDNLTIKALQQQLLLKNLRFADDDSFDDLFHRAFLQWVEPALQRYEQPVFLTYYPTLMAALARKSPDDARVAERFELYVAGIELANGFGELTDAVEQRERFIEAKEVRQKLGKRDYPLDEAFLSALKTMPQAAGIALGFDRLLMLLLNTHTLDEVAFIPWSQA